MSAQKIKKGDHVIVLTGRDKGKHGEVIEVRPKENRALVRGVNVVRRHQKQTAQQEAPHLLHIYGWERALLKHTLRRGLQVTGPISTVAQ